MAAVPDSIKRRIAHPTPDIDAFTAVITGRRTPTRVHLAELFADQETMQWMTENVLEKPWVPYTDTDRHQQEKHRLCEIDYWYRMGYDFIRVTGGIPFSVHTSKAASGARHWVDQHAGPIGSREDFDRYPWPKITDDALWQYHFIAEHLPAGMGMFLCPTSGFLEIPTALIGYETLAMMTVDDPELVADVFQRVGELITEVYRRLIDLPQVAGCFQGDDMGHRTGTLFSPEFLRRHSLPHHRTAAKLAHDRNKIYMMHACGNLYQIMDELIDDIKIDAKHSYEDAIQPVEDAFDIYGQRMGLLGGLDLDLLTRGSIEQVRRRSEQILTRCAGGRYAFGSGNSLASYCRHENILAMWDVAANWFR
jgi:uroporphyrinogen decarboxylase